MTPPAMGRSRSSSILPPSSALAVRLDDEPLVVGAAEQERQLEHPGLRAALEADVRPHLGVDRDAGVLREHREEQGGLGILRARPQRAHHAAQILAAREPLELVDLARRAPRDRTGERGVLAGERGVEVRAALGLGEARGMPRAPRPCRASRGTARACRGTACRARAWRASPRAPRPRRACGRPCRAGDRWRYCR